MKDNEASEIYRMIDTQLRPISSIEGLFPSAPMHKKASSYLSIMVSVETVFSNYAKSISYYIDKRSGCVVFILPVSHKKPFLFAPEKEKIKSKWSKK